MKNYFRVLSLFLALVLICQMFVICSLAAAVSGDCGSGVVYSLNVETGDLILDGYGATDDYSRFGTGYSLASDDDEGWSPIWRPGTGSSTTSKYVPWKDYVNYIQTVTIGEGVTRVGNNAFSQCLNIGRVTFLSPDTEISDSAFSLSDGCFVNLYRDSTADRYFSDSDVIKIYFETYTISYNANGGENAPEAQTKTGNFDLILWEDIPTREGFSFMGWATSSDGEVVYQPGDTVTENADLVLYAVWKDEGAGGDEEPEFVLAPESDFEYNINGTTAIITEYLGSGGNIIIPSTLGGYTVTEIGGFTFSSIEGLTGVIIPDSVTNIASYGFYTCGDLKTIDIGNGVRSIGLNAFRSCQNLKDITFSDRLQSIGETAFEYCGFETIALPESLTSIGEGAFNGCKELKSVTIPANVSSIGNFAFAWGKALAEINVDESNEAFCDIDGVLYSKDAKTLIQYPAGKSDAEYTVPSGVNSIGVGAFDHCSALVNIFIPEGVKSIGIEAFSYCESLEYVEIPNGVESIEECVFYGCDSLTSIIIPESVKNIASYSVSYCSSLDAITFETKDAIIAPDMINECENLTTIYLYKYSTADAYFSAEDYEKIYLDEEGGDDPEEFIFEYRVNGEGTVAVAEYFGDGGEVVIPSEVDGYTVTEIFDEVFLGCEEITKVTIPATVAKIGESVFWGCSGLAEIEVDENNANYCDVDGVLFTKDMKKIIAYPAGNAATEYEIPVGVSEVGESAFHLSNLKNVTIPEGVEIINRCAFFDNRSLESVSFPASLTTICGEAFTYCDSLKTIDIHAGIEVIEDRVFSACTSLEYINVDDENANYCDVDGVLFTKEMETIMTYPIGKADKEYSIPEGVVYIDAGAFEETVLEAVELPESVTYIGALAFVGADFIEKIVIPQWVNVIETFAFEWCVGLKEITIPENVEIIGDSVFGYCVNLKSVRFESTYVEIYENAFGGCESLEAVYVYKDSTADGFFSEEDYMKIYLGIEDDTIEIEYDEEAFEEGVVMNLEELKGAELGNFAISKENGEKPHMVGFDITFELDGEAVQPETPVKVKLKVPQNFNGKKCKVYHIADDGTVTDMNAEFVDGYMFFETDHFSKYVVADMSAAVIGDTNSDGEIDVKDAVLLAQYLAGWSVTVDMDAADCNADGEVDVKDAVLLAQYLAGWSVTLG